MLGRPIRKQLSAGAARALAAAATLTVAACNAPDPRPRPVLLTSADFASLVAANADPNEGLTPGYGLPGGMPLKRILTTQNGAPTLALRQTLTETYRSAYVTTEIWAGFPSVWVQPAYVAVSGYVDGAPTRVPPPPAPWHPIFSVGPGSAFYSPYWQVFYFEVPPGDDVASFVSVRDVLDRGLRIREGEGRVMPLVPVDLEPPPPTAADDKSVQKIGGPKKGTGWLGGSEVHFLDFGGGTFTWDEYGVVEEAPIFVWVARDEGGELHALDIPTVAGTGPLYANRPPKVWGPNMDVPKYGSYWRIYTVEVPSTARVFAPPDAQELRSALAGSFVLDAMYDLTIKTVGTGLATYVGRVAMNPACFQTADDVLSGAVDDPSQPNCRYLDSQEKIELHIPGAAIERTDLLVTCPFVSYRDAAVIP
jgi:hypothetical protein